MEAVFCRPTMSEKDFRRFSTFIENECGIKMPLSKKFFLESRFMKRLWKLDIKSFSEYYNYVFSPKGITGEISNMIDVVTTNKTDFFREPAHFDYLIQEILPELVTKEKMGFRKKLMVWSAGCSTGEEPYTLAIVMNEFAEKNAGFSYSILASDISTRVLEKAKVGIYEQERIWPIPTELRKKYLLKSKDRDSGIVRIVPELRTRVKFIRLNLMDDDFGFQERMDIIFCRNVLIYFDKPSQKRLIEKLCHCLSPGGYIFIGHSETLHGLDVSLLGVAPAIYRYNP
ncbi:MAG: protein-glutamate O-methyltransferase [Nitrospirota bacterium]